MSSQVLAGYITYFWQIGQLIRPVRYCWLTCLYCLARSITAARFAWYWSLLLSLIWALLASTYAPLWSIQETHNLNLYLNREESFGARQLVQYISLLSFTSIYNTHFILFPTGSKEITYFSGLIQVSVGLLIHTMLRCTSFFKISIYSTPISTRPIYHDHHSSLMCIMWICVHLLTPVWSLMICLTHFLIHMHNVIAISPYLWHPLYIQLYSMSLIIFLSLFQYIIASTTFLVNRMKILMMAYVQYI